MLVTGAERLCRTGAVVLLAPGHFAGGSRDRLGSDFLRKGGKLF